jgi:nucleotide-binding universal stress UspA family protein
VPGAGAAAERFGRILCPVDFSPASVRAAREAAELAAAEQGRVTLLHVTDGRTPDARERLKGVFDAEGSHWLEGEPILAEGKPHEEILRVARERGVDVIVMGVHGHGALRRLLGSTTRHVVREAPCPVLAVPPEKDGQAR